MDEILDENVPVSPEHLRKELLARFIKVLEQDEKIHISHREIKDRLQEYLRKQLDLHSQNINKRPRVQIEENKSISDGQFSDACAKILSSAVNNPDLLANDGFIGVVHLMKEGVFKPDEVTKDNVLEIINEFIKTQITCHDIVSARSNGDFVKELSLFSERAKQNNQIEVQSSASKEETKIPSLKFSELANKYIDSKISDEAWKSHSLPDHKSRLNTFIEVMGDKAIDEITRDDMRKYRETLRKLPPNRAKSKLYKGKSIEQILKMKPKTVYSVKTVNIFVEAASSLFEWAMREGIMTFNLNP